jgi:SAM-dependent methyltransferase
MIMVLPRIVPADPGKPTRTGAADTQHRARDLARHPSSWTSIEAAQTVATYAELAVRWDDERGAYRPVPLADALARGGELPTGACAEVGCGTGLLTAMLVPVWPLVVSLDLSPDMLARMRTGRPVRADAARLPLASAALAAVVLADAPLFAPEVVRVLRPDGVVVWSNALGSDAPHHVPTADLVAAFSDADSGRAWAAVASEAGWGSWVVLRRVAP